jgi:hypothetical protein
MRTAHKRDRENCRRRGGGCHHPPPGISGLGHCSLLLLAREKSRPTAAPPGSAIALGVACGGAVWCNARSAWPAHVARSKAKKRHETRRIGSVRLEHLKVVLFRRYFYIDKSGSPCDRRRTLQSGSLSLTKSRLRAAADCAVMLLLKSLLWREYPLFAP